MEFAVGLLDLYRRYSKNMLNHLVEIEEAYLSAKGYSSLPVSATVKFYDRPFCPQKDERKGIHVYTAFRDSRTYDKHEREIGEKLYTIDGNADFVRCLQKEHFLINNAVRNSDSYMNEHTDFDAYYNCTIVVPIRAKLPDGSYKHFGYLCCDCLNSERKCEIFDQPAAQYLFAVAQQYATFLDTLDANWIDRTKEISELPESILHMIYQKTYIGESGTEKEIPQGMRSKVKGKRLVDNGTGNHSTRAKQKRQADMRGNCTGIPITPHMTRDYSAYERNILREYEKHLRHLLDETNG